MQWALHCRTTRMQLLTAGFALSHFLTLNSQCCIKASWYSGNLTDFREDKAQKDHCKKVARESTPFQHESISNTTPELLHTLRISAHDV